MQSIRLSTWSLRQKRKREMDLYAETMRVLQLQIKNVVSDYYHTLKRVERDLLTARLQNPTQVDYEYRDLYQWLESEYRWCNFMSTYIRLIDDNYRLLHLY